MFKHPLTNMTHWYFWKTILFNLFVTSVVTFYNSPFDRVESIYNDFITKITAVDSLYCNRACEMMLPLIPYETNTLCAQCYCDDSCETYGDCCTDLVLLQNYTQTINNFIRCEPDSLKLASTFYMMINACPGYLNQTNVNWCKERSDEKWLSNIPVTSDRTGKTYRNVYCASCHGVHDVTSWETRVHCDLNSKAFTNTSSVNDIYKNSVHDSDCKVRFIPKERGNLRSCSETDEIIIKECNVSGVWRIYDARVEKACHSYRNIVHEKYWNVFCYFCNINVPWFFIAKERAYPSDMTTRVGLIALLQVEEIQDSHQSSKNTQCSSGQIFDPYKETCRHVACPPGKQLHNDLCSSVVKDTNMFGYRLCVLVYISPPQPLGANNIALMGLEIAQSLNKNIPENALSPNISLEILDIKNCEENDLQILWKLEMYLFLPNTVLRDQFEVELMAIMLNVSDDVHQWYNKSDIVVIPSCEHGFQNTLLKCMEPDTETIFSLENSIPYIYEDIVDKLTILDINALLICPQVILHEDEVILPSPNLSIPYPTFSLIIKANKRTVGSNSYALLSNGSIQICAHSYIDSDFRHGSKDVAISTITIVSIVCTGLSLLFLVLSFAVYSLVPKLRTSGGVSNMGLIVTLFVAQSLFQFGVENTEVYTLCFVIGISVHLFWLASVWWMNAIIIYLFYTLSFPLQSLTLVPDVRKVFLMSLLYSYGCSAIVVLGTISANLVIFGDTGYVGDICYLKRDNATKFAFCLPIAILVLSNIILFVVTMWKLHRRSSVGSSNEHKVSMVACVKLSTTTGLSWVFAYLYLFTKVTEFSVIFSILVSSQGMLLFLAFLANKRVWDMCQQQCKPRKRQRSSASTSVFTTNSNV